MHLAIKFDMSSAATCLIVLGSRSSLARRAETTAVLFRRGPRLKGNPPLALQSMKRKTKMLALATWMMSVADFLRSGLRASAGETGQDMVEYALVIGVVSIAIVALFIAAPFGNAFNAVATAVCAKVGAVC